jgi:hypothetical protein
MPFALPLREHVGRKANAIVTDADPNGSRTPGGFDGDGCGMGMALCIEERFTDDRLNLARYRDRQAWREGSMCR